MNVDRNDFRLEILFLSFVVYCSALADDPAVGRAQEFVSVEQYSKNKHVVEVRRMGVDGWPELVESLVLDSEDASQRSALHRFQARSRLTYKSHQTQSPPLRSSTPLPLWHTTEAWSEVWEQQYSDWIAQEVDKTFFERHNIATDCADIVFAARWIFSRIHGLPAAFELAGSNAVFTNHSVRASWLQLPTAAEWNNDQRFLASLNYLLDHTNTISLRAAGYPIAINANTLKPGVYRVRTNDGGQSRHTYLFHRFFPDPSNEYPILFLQSDLPRSVRVVAEVPFEPRQSRGSPGEGLQRIRWAVQNGPNVEILAPDAHPHFSEQQFDDSLFPEDQWAMKILQIVNPRFNMDWMGRVVTQTLVQNLANRAQIVEQGYAHCQRNDCSEGSAAFEDWSTPARDKKLMEYYETYRWYADWTELKSKFVVISGREYPVLFVYAFLDRFRGSGSSDPRVSVEERWGFFPNPFIKGLEAALTDFSQRRVLCLRDSACDLSEFNKDIYPSVIWKAQAFSEHASNPSVREALNGIIKLVSTQHLSLNGKSRSLRQWMAFFVDSLYASSSRDVDPWGATFGDDWKVGAFGESVYAVDLKNEITLTNTFLINERTQEVVVVDGVAGPVRGKDPEHHLVSIGRNLYDWESGFKVDCESDYGKDVFVMDGARFVLCANKVWMQTPQGFQLYKSDFSSARAILREGRTAVLALCTEGQGVGRLFFPDGTEKAIDGCLETTDFGLTQNHVLFRRNIGGNTTQIAMDVRTGVEISIDAVLPSRGAVIRELSYEGSSDVVLVMDDKQQLWKLDLSGVAPVTQLIASGVDASSRKVLLSPREVLWDSYGWSFLIPDDPATQDVDQRYVNILHKGQQFQLVPVDSSYLHSAVPTSDGISFCAGDSAYKWGTAGLVVLNSQSCTLPTRTSILTSIPGSDKFIKNSLFGNERISDLRPEVGFTEAWNEDYIPRWRTKWWGSSSYFGSIWFGVRSIFPTP